MYIYNADVYCDECGEDLKRHLKMQGKRPAEWEDESTYDSSEWPKGPYSPEEADSPQHCGSGEDCLDPYLLSDGRYIGKFLKNPLTDEGVRYVREAHRDNPTEITDLWMWHYDLKALDDISDESTPDDEEIAPDEGLFEHFKGRLTNHIRSKISFYTYAVKLYEQYRHTETDPTRVDELDIKTSTYKAILGELRSIEEAFLT